MRSNSSFPDTEEDGEPDYERLSDDDDDDDTDGITSSIISGETLKGNFNLQHTILT